MNNPNPPRGRGRGDPRRGKQPSHGQASSSGSGASGRGQRLLRSSGTAPYVAGPGAGPEIQQIASASVQPPGGDPAPLQEDPSYEELRGYEYEQFLRWISGKFPKTICPDSRTAQVIHDEEINGAVFLDSNAAFFETCGISKGTSRALEILSNELKEKATNREKRKSNL